MKTVWNVVETFSDDGFSNELVEEDCCRGFYSNNSIEVLKYIAL